MTLIVDEVFLHDAAADKHEWDGRSFVCITKEALKDAKPYALKQMTDAMANS